GGRLARLRVGALECPAFRRYLAAQGVSLVGTWMQGAAQAWLVLQLTGSAVLLGTVSAVQSLPVLMLSLFAGAVADHVNRRRLLIVTQSALAASATVLGLLTVSGRVRYWHVVAIAGIYGIFNTLDMPGRNTFLGDMVPRHALASAIGLHSTIFNVARIVGPGVAGAVVASIGSGPAFLLNALSFVPVIGVLATMRVPRDSEQAPAPRASRLPRDPRRIGRPVVEGVRYVWDSWPIRQSLLLLGIVSLFSMNFQVLVPVYAQRALGQGASGYGLLMSSLGAGALVAAAGVASTRGAEPPPWRRSLGVVALGLALLGLAVNRSYALAVVLLGVAGWGMVSLSVSTNALVQLSSAEEMRGRVMSTFTLVLVGVTPIGSLVVGDLADRFGVPAAAAVGGLAALLAWAWLRPWTVRAALSGRADTAPAP
ncbi:MAG: MFS transporter, partial [Bacillota bacterium]